MGERAGPPRFLEALVRRLLPRGAVGASILGDLREDMARQRAAGARFVRARWSVRAAGVALRYRLPSPPELAVAATDTARGAARAARTLLRRPTSTGVAVLVLALGSGLATFMFSLVYGVSFRHLDVPAPHELRTVSLVDPAGGRTRPATEDDLLAWREGDVPFTALSAWRGATFNVSGEAAAPERRAGARMTPEAFRTLGVEPALGRLFTAEDALPGAPRVVLLGDGLWRSRFGAAGDVLGRTVRLDGEPATVVGVMPAGFRFPTQHDLWAPLHVAPSSPHRGADGDAGGAGVAVFGRLRAGVEPGAAAAALEQVLRRREAAGGGVREPARVQVQTFSQGIAGMDALLAGMMAAGLLVLAVACANVSGVLLARAAARARETGVRATLGAGRLRAAAPFVAEAFVLALAGSAGGVALATAGASLFERAVAGQGKPYWMTIAVDAPVLSFVLAVVAVVTLLSGAAPAWLALRSGPGPLVPRGGRGGPGELAGRTGRVLVVLQVALSCTLLVGTALVLRSLANLSSMDFPFAREDVLTARFGAHGAARPDSLSRAVFYGDLLEVVGSLPGVEAAAISGGLPTMSMGEVAVRAEGAEGLAEAELPRALRAAGTAGVLEVLGIPLAGGRDVRASDAGDSEPVAVVDREMADRLFGEEDPIGRRFREVVGEREGPWRTVAGLVDDLHLEGVNQLDHGFGYYVPLAQADPPWTAVVVRTTRGPSATVADVRAAVAALDPDLPLYDVMSMRAVAGSERWFFVAFGGVFAAFGAAALVMAALGLYGVLSFSVARRVPEMGIRMALGAAGSGVGRLVVGDAARQVGIGAAVGLALSLVAADGLRVVLFQVEPRDPLVYVWVALTVALVALVAAAAPALRAARLDPCEALRRE